MKNLVLILSLAFTLQAGANEYENVYKSYIDSPEINSYDIQQPYAPPEPQQVEQDDDDIGRSYPREYKRQYKRQYKRLYPRVFK